MSKRTKVKLIRKGVKANNMKILDAFGGDIVNFAAKLTMDMYKDGPKNNYESEKDQTIEDVMRQFNTRNEDNLYLKFIKCNNINKSLLSTSVNEFTFDDYLCLVGLTISFYVQCNAIFNKQCDVHGKCSGCENERISSRDNITTSTQKILQNLHKHENILSYYRRLIMLVKNNSCRNIFWTHEQTLDLEINTYIQKFQMKWWSDFIIQCLYNGQKMLNLYVDYTYGHPSSDEYIKMIHTVTRSDKPIEFSEEQVFELQVKTRLLGTLLEKKSVSFVNCFVGYVMSVYITSSLTANIYRENTICCRENNDFSLNVVATRLFKFLCGIRNINEYEEYAVYAHTMLELINNHNIRDKSDIEKEELFKTYGLDSKNPKFLDLSWYAMYARNYGSLFPPVSAYSEALLTY